MGKDSKNAANRPTAVPKLNLKSLAPPKSTPTPSQTAPNGAQNAKHPSQATPTSARSQQAFSPPTNHQSRQPGQQRTPESARRPTAVSFAPGVQKRSSGDGITPRNFLGSRTSSTESNANGKAVAMRADNVSDRRNQGKDSYQEGV